MFLFSLKILKLYKFHQLSGILLSLRDSLTEKFSKRQFIIERVTWIIVAIIDYVLCIHIFACMWLLMINNFSEKNDTLQNAVFVAS